MEIKNIEAVNKGVIMAIPKVEDLSIEILNIMRDNIEYSRESLINEQRRILLVTKEEENKFQLTIGLAITRLWNLGMIKKAERGVYVITDLGREQLRIDREELKKRLTKYDTSVKENRKKAYKIFEKANKRFLKEEKENINRNISERNLCQNLANYLRDSMEEMRNRWILCRCRI